MPIDDMKKYVLMLNFNILKDAFFFLCEAIFISLHNRGGGGEVY